MKRERKYYIAILIIVALYIIGTIFFDIEPLSKLISTVTTIIAAVAFWLQFKRTESLNESSYIMNLNNQFVNNKDMTMIEHILELYYNEYEFNYNKRNLKTKGHGISTIELKMNLSRESEDCQKLVNYLVYLEALAAIIERNVLHLNIIDNLFAYRFFLAVNNPVVQETELIPYKDYYKGIFFLSREWTELYNRENTPIPMVEFNLADMNVESRLKEDCVLSVDFAQASIKDNFEEIALCIYETDPYIYPAAFGNDAPVATQAISKLVGNKGGLFDLDNIIVAKYNGHIIGACLVYDKPSTWNTAEYYDEVKDVLPQDNAFKYTSKEYFEVTTSEIKTDEVYIMAFCIVESFRGRGVSNPFMRYVTDQYRKKNIHLEVLSDNTSAINMYKKMGFIETEEREGFSKEDMAKPKCKLMIKNKQD